MSDKDVNIPIPRKLVEKLWPFLLSALLGASGWGGHALLSGAQDSKVAVLENRMDTVEKGLDKINDKLDRLLERHR